MWSNFHFRRNHVRTSSSRRGMTAFSPGRRPGTCDQDSMCPEKAAQLMQGLMLCCPFRAVFTFGPRSQGDALGWELCWPFGPDALNPAASLHEGGRATSAILFVSIRVVKKMRCPFSLFSAPARLAPGPHPSASTIATRHRWIADALARECRPP